MDDLGKRGRVSLIPTLVTLGLLAFWNKLEYPQAHPLLSPAANMLTDARFTAWKK